MVDSAMMTKLARPGNVDSFEKENDQKGEFNPYSSYHPPSKYGKPKAILFLFDPNKISTEQWQLLGLREKTIHTIQNYLSKGGKFRKPEDLKKVYGLFPDEYERLAPFIKIENRNAEIENMNSNPDRYRDDTPMMSPKKVSNHSSDYHPRIYSMVEINSADTSQLIALPGIGSKLASRIINFRDKLGGFYSIEQVRETFGLPDSTFQKIKKYLKIENVSVKKININTASLEELKGHPYIRYAIANAVVSFRKEHGDFKKVEELKNLMIITEESYQKIIPYLYIEGEKY